MRCIWVTQKTHIQNALFSHGGNPGLNNDDHEPSASIQSTMVGPLYARAKYSKVYPDLLQDEKADGLYAMVLKQHPDSTDEFKILDKFIDEFLGLSFLIRARTLDDTIRRFIEKRPKATIVNVACGLDTTYSRVDNGSLLWYDLDLPDAIEYRRRLIPETERSKCIPKSFFDPSWMDDIAFSETNGLLMIAGGFFAYFDEERIADLFRTMAQRFPGGEIIFDSSSARGNWFINRRFKKFGVEGIEHRFEAKSQNQIERWSPQIEVVDWFSYFSRVEKNQAWSRRTRFLMSLNNRLMLAKFVHVRFKEIAGSSS
jgi:O-methyltransferase involved in polyketide biosynthesis